MQRRLSELQVSPDRWVCHQTSDGFDLKCDVIQVRDKAQRIVSTMGKDTLDALVRSKALRYELWDAASGVHIFRQPPLPCLVQEAQASVAN